MLNKLTNNKKGERMTKENTISKIKNIIKVNPNFNQNLTDVDLKEFLNGFENNTKALNFINAHIELEKIKERI